MTTPAELYPYLYGDDAASVLIDTATGKPAVAKTLRLYAAKAGGEPIVDLQEPDGDAWSAGAVYTGSNGAPVPFRSRLPRLYAIALRSDGSEVAGERTVLVPNNWGAAVEDERAARAAADAAVAAAAAAAQTAADGAAGVAGTAVQPAALTTAIATERTSERAHALGTFAPLAAPALTGAATLDGEAVETTTAAQAKANAALAPFSINARLGGLAGDAAIRDAITQAQGSSNPSEVFLPAGSYAISVRPDLPTNTPCVLRGAGRTKTRLVADAALTGYMVKLGAFHSRIEDLTLDCNNLPGLDGVLINEAQEMSGLFRVLVDNYRGRAVHAGVAGGAFTPQNYYLEELELYASASHDGVLPSLHISGTAPQSVDKITVNVKTLVDLPVGSTAVLVECGKVPLRNMHIEHHNIGVKGGSAAGSATGLLTDNINMSQGVTRGIVLHASTTTAALRATHNSSTGRTSVIEDGLSGLVLNGADTYAEATFQGSTAATRDLRVAASGAGGGINQMANLTVNGYLKIPTVAALPAANGGTRHRLIAMDGASGSPDRVLVLAKQADNTYAWLDLL